MTTSKKLKPLHVDGYRMGAWNDEDATTKNNVLAASSAENMAIPSGSKVVRLMSTADCFYNMSATAVIPTDDTSDDTFLPALTERWITIQSATNISLIAVGTPTVTGNFWE